MSKGKMSVSNFSIKAHRVSKKSDFSLLYKQGKSHNYKNLKIRHLDSDGESFRCAFVISRKVGNAIHRNKIRRIIRDSIYQYSPKTPAMFLIQYFPKNKKTFNKSELRQDIFKLLGKAGF